MSRDRSALRDTQLDIDEFASEFDEYLPSTDDFVTTGSPTLSPGQTMSPTNIPVTVSSPRASPRASPVVSPRASPSPVVRARPRPIVSPRVQPVAQPRATRETRARASPRTTTVRASPRASPRTTTVRASPRVSTRESIPYVNIQARSPKVSPHLKKSFDAGLVPDIQVTRAEGVEANEVDLMSLFAGTKAVREPVNIQRPLQGVSTSVERQLPLTDKSKLPTQSRTVGDFMPRAIFDRYTEYITKDIFGTTNDDGELERAFRMSEGAKELLKLALESYMSSFIESGKMIASIKGKITLSGDDLMLLSELPIAKR